ncbi:hypothetical protein [Massilia sp. TS11]|uniref:hypothetical protein n=1 Tax=Massilia sp. TS11 TaxID=2908003 RepID=UPI001EDB5F72|nr:hypothetical protein [Massilia sp. TS11]MCG2586806.1 hypothetical protein [Massilia sp. TS11]
MKLTHLSLLLIWLFSLPAPLVHAQQTIDIEVKESGFDPKARMRSYSAACKETIYEVQVSKDDRSVRLIVHGATTTQIDLLSAPLGRALLNEAVLGEVNFGCGPNWVNIYIVGVELQKQAPPVGFTSLVRYDKGKGIRWQEDSKSDLERINRQLLDY